MMRAVAAAVLPFLATELGASSGESPVVMHGPDRRDPVVSQILEKHPDIEIVLAKRMDVDQIGFEFLQLADEEPGVDHVEIAVQTRQKRDTLGNDAIQPGADIDLVLISVFQTETGTAAAGIGFEALFTGRRGDIQNDISCRSVIVAVDLNHSFHH